MTYIFDECVSWKVVGILKDAGFQDILHITELWSAGTLDSVFLPEIGKRGDILVTVDPAMLHTRGQHGHMALLKEYKVKALFLPRGYFNARAIQQFSWMSDHWEIIVKGVKEIPDFTLGKVLSNGRIEPIK